MIDIVVSGKDHEDFVSMAKKLGYDKLVLLGTKITKKLGKPDRSDKPYVIDGVDIYSCGKKGSYDLICADKNFRDAVEKKKADIIYGAEADPRSDFIHQRNSGLDHIICRFARDNNIAVAFSFSSLLNRRTRAKVMGRMAQNIRLCRKYRLKMIIASFADEPYNMRSPSDLISLFVTLGMQKKEAKDALSYAYELILKKRHDKENLIAPGVELVK